MREEGARALKTAVSFNTGEYKPDYWAMQTKAFIILPWDRWVVADGELVVRPDYEAALREAGAAGSGGGGAEGGGRAGRTGSPARKAGT
jgi:hypothetical protein